MPDYIEEKVCPDDCLKERRRGDQKAKQMDLEVKRKEKQWNEEITFMLCERGEGKRRQETRWKYCRNSKFTKEY